MNLRDLEYLAAVGELKNFRKAAEKCFVSQPTLSGQLKKLEIHLGVKLVERNTRNVFLTPIGGKIVGPALLEQPDTTIFIEPNMYGEVDHIGNLLIRWCEE